MTFVRFARSVDGTALAWTRTGSGPPMLKTANWLTHLKFDYSGPIWTHWVRFFDQNFTITRYDERGCGLSDRQIGELSFERWIEDIEAVVEASDIEEPFVLLGISQGASTAIGYAVRYPEKVSKLILYGGFARGAARRGSPEMEQLYNAIVEILRLGWYQSNPAFQDVFTSRFLPGATAEQRGWFNELCHKTLSPDTGPRLLMARSEIDIVGKLAEVSVPTLIIHADGDEVVPLAESELMARSIPGARLSVVPGRNHILLEADEAWPETMRLICEFALEKTPEALPDGLTEREIAVLRLICAAHSNKVIAHRLGLTEKTVRNHASNLFSKVGVRSRQEAILRFSGLLS